MLNISLEAHGPVETKCKIIVILQLISRDRLQVILSQIIMPKAIGP